MYHLMILTYLCISVFLYSWEIGLTLRFSPRQWRWCEGFSPFLLPSVTKNNLQDWIQTPKLHTDPHDGSHMFILCALASWSSSLCFMWVLCCSLSLSFSICLFLTGPREKQTMAFYVISGVHCGHLFIWSFTHQSVLSSSMCLKDVWKCILPTPGGP